MNSPQRDFPCPLCNKPCNTVLPVAPELNLLQARAARRRLLEDSLALELRFPAWLSAMLAAQRAAHLLVAGENQEQQLRVLTPSLASLRLPESAEALRALYTSHYARPLLASDRPERDFAQMQEKFACDNFDQWQARLLDQPQPDRSDERLVANLRRTAAYTLIAMDQYLRFCDEEKPTPLFGGMPSMRQWESTQALVRLACIAQGQLTDENDSKRLRGTAFHLLRPLLPLLPPTESELEVEVREGRDEFWINGWILFEALTFKTSFAFACRTRTINALSKPCIGTRRRIYWRWTSSICSCRWPSRRPCSSSARRTSA